MTKKTLVRGRPGPLNSWKSADAVAVTGSEDSRRTGEGKSLPAKSGSPQDDAVFASRREAADFIADYLTELMLVAVRHGMPDLAYSIGKSLSKANEKKLSPIDPRHGSISDTSWRGWRCSRPARSSSSKMMWTLRVSMPVQRMTSSMSIGLGPNASITRSRSV